MEVMIMAPSIVMLLVSLMYSYILVTKIPKATFRILSLLPVFYMFSIFPWYFSSGLFRGITSFFITFISSFKLLLFCFNQGPVILHKNYVDFVLLTVFPFKIRENCVPPPTPPKRVILLFVMLVLFYMIIDKAEIKNFPQVMLFLHGLSIFSGLYMVLTYRATVVRAMSRYELVQLFNKPYLATSLHDFWGRRWNRYSSNILRQAIYDPTRKALKGIVGYGPAKVVSLIVSLVVSGVMHELMFHYITCGKKPTWEVTWFFVLQGVCMIIEAGLNNLLRVKGWNPIHPAIRVMCTAGILFAMFYWLLVLPVWRSAENDCGYIIGSSLD